MNLIVGLLHLCNLVHVLALMAWFGALCLRRLLGGGQGGGELRALQTAGALALVSGAAWPWLQTAALTEDPAAAWDPQQVAVVLTGTSFGRTWLLREAAIVLAFLASVNRLLAIGRGVHFLVAASLASFALLGHAAGAEGSSATAQRLALAVHLLAGGAWLGALLPLHALCARLAPVDLARVLQRFSRYALGLVVVVLATGVASAAWRLGAASMLWQAGYGRLLLLKVGLVGIMGMLALRNRNLLTPRLLTGDSAARGQAQAALRGTIAVESVVGLLVVLAAVLLAAADAPQ